MEKIILDQYDLNKMGSAARKFVNENRSWTKITKKVECIYAKALDA